MFLIESVELCGLDERSNVGVDPALNHQTSLAKSRLWPPTLAKSALYAAFWAMSGAFGLQVSSLRFSLFYTKSSGMWPGLAGGTESHLYTVFPHDSVRLTDATSSS